MKDNIQFVGGLLLVIYVLYSILGFVIGTLDVSVGFHKTDLLGYTYYVHECPYKSIGSRTNLGYVIGCELFEERY